jgi:VWFA-related protein
MSGQPGREHFSVGRALAIATCGLVLAFALAGPRSTSAQATGPSVVVNQVDSSAYPNLQAVVTVLTAAGVPAPGLMADAFEVAEPQTAEVTSVVGAQDAALPLGIVIAIDTSGSMDGPPIAAARAAADQFVGQLGPNDQAAIVSFSDAARVVVPFTADHAQLTAGIDQLSAQGSTALYEAVQAADYAARASQLPRQAVVLLTDGNNDTTTSASTEAGSLETARSAHVPMFTVAYGADADTAYLARLANESGGRDFAAGQLDVAQTYASIATLLRSQYVVSLRSDERADGRSASLRISVNVDGQVATSAPAPFVRGEAPPPATATVVPTPAASETDARGRGTGPLLVVVAAIVGAGVVLGSALLLLRAMKRTRAQHERDRHAGRVSDESIPVQRHSRVVQRRMDETIELLHFDRDGQTHSRAVGGTPLVIGSSVESDIRLAESEDVAARHATVWLGDGRLRLRHVGGSRPTLVNGRPVEVMILDTGDEFTIGGDRFRVGTVSSAEAV